MKLKNSCRLLRKYLVFMILISANADLIAVSCLQSSYTNSIKTQACVICTPAAPSKATEQSVGGSCALVLHGNIRLFLPAMTQLLVVGSVKLNCLKSGS